jgi:hypothetical protein
MKKKKVSTNRKNMSVKELWKNSGIEALFSSNDLALVLRWLDRLLNSAFGSGRTPREKRDLANERRRFTAALGAKIAAIFQDLRVFVDGDPYLRKKINLNFAVADHPEVKASAGLREVFASPPKRTLETRLLEAAERPLDDNQRPKKRSRTSRALDRGRSVAATAVVAGTVNLLQDTQWKMYGGRVTHTASGALGRLTDQIPEPGPVRRALAIRMPTNEEIGLRADALVAADNWTRDQALTALGVVGKNDPRVPDKLYHDLGNGYSLDVDAWNDNKFKPESASSSSSSFSMPPADQVLWDGFNVVGSALALGVIGEAANQGVQLHLRKYPDSKVRYLQKAARIAGTVAAFGGYALTAYSTLSAATAAYHGDMSQLVPLAQTMGVNALNVTVSGWSASLVKDFAESKQSSVKLVYWGDANNSIADEKGNLKSIWELASVLLETSIIGDLGKYYDIVTETDNIQFRIGGVNMPWMDVLPQLQVKDFYNVTIEIRVVRNGVQLPFKVQPFDVDVKFYGLFQSGSWTLQAATGPADAEKRIRRKVTELYRYTPLDKIDVIFWVGSKEYATLRDMDVRQFNQNDMEPVSVAVKFSNDEEAVPFKLEGAVSPELRQIATANSVPLHRVTERMVEQFYEQQRKLARQAKTKEIQERRLKTLQASKLQTEQDILDIKKKSLDIDFQQKQRDEAWTLTEIAQRQQQRQQQGQQQRPGAVSSAALTAVGGEDIEAAAQLLVDSGVFL